MKVEPADLQLRVAAIVIEALVARGTACFQQIRRRYLNAEEEDGKQVIRIKGNVVRKTLPGRAADYEPINVVISTAFSGAIVVGLSEIAVQSPTYRSKSFQ